MARPPPAARPPLRSVGAAELVEKPPLWRRVCRHRPAAKPAVCRAVGAELDRECVVLFVDWEGWYVLFLFRFPFFSLLLCFWEKDGVGDWVTDCLVGGRTELDGADC